MAPIVKVELLGVAERIEHLPRGRDVGIVRQLGLEHDAHFVAGLE